MRPSNTSNDTELWILTRKLTQEKRLEQIQLAKDLKQKITAKNKLSSDEKFTFTQFLIPLACNYYGEYIATVQNPEYKYGYQYFSTNIPDQIVDSCIIQYEQSLNSEYEESLKNKSLNIPFSRKVDNSFRTPPLLGSKYLLKEKVGNTETKIEIDCDYNYDHQRDFPSFQDELPKSKPFIGFGLLTQEAPSDELVRGFVNSIVSGWYLRNEEKPNTVDELYSQNKKAYLLLNEGQHWLSVELSFEKNSSGNVVNVDYCNPAGSQQSSFSTATESLVKKVVGCLEGFILDDKIGVISTLGDKAGRQANINQATENVPVTEATNVQIKEKHLLKQATVQGCGPTAKANLALLMGDKVKIGNVEISVSEIPTEGLGLFPEDELRLRLQDYYEILKFDDQITETRCGVDYKPIATLENLSPIKEYKNPASPNLPPPRPRAQQPSQLDEATKQKQWHKKYGSIVKNPLGLNEEASRNLTGMVANFNEAQQLSGFIQNIIKESEDQEGPDGPTKTTAELLTSVMSGNEVPQNIKNFFLNDEGSVKTEIFKMTPFNIGDIENVGDLLSKRAEELDPKHQMIKKLIKYQLAQVRDEKDAHKKAYKIKTLRNLVNQSTSVPQIGIRNENPEDFLYELFYMLYDDLPIVCKENANNSYHNISLAFLDLGNDSFDLNILEATSNNDLYTFSIKEGVDEIIFNPMRFDDNKRSVKFVNNTILDDITLPIEGSETGATQVFEATAFICHKGSAIDNGKFVTYIKGKDKKWNYYNEQGLITEAIGQNLEDAKKSACAIKYSATGRDILPVHQFEATDLDGNMSWATSAAIFAGSFTSLGLDGVSLTQKEIDLLESDSIGEMFAKLKVSSGVDLNPDDRELEYLLETFEFNYDEKNEVHRIRLTEIRKSNVLRNGIEELVNATSISPPIPKSPSQAKILLSNLEANPNKFLNQKVLVKVGDGSNQQFSAIEAAKEKIGTASGNLINCLKDQERKSFLNYAAKSILKKATKEPKKLESFDQVLWNKESGSKNGKVGQKAWYQRYSNTYFKGVDFSKTLFMTRFVGCTFDKECKFSDLRAIKPEYFSNCFFHEDMFAKDASGNLKDGAKNLMKKFGIDPSATTDDEGYYKVAKLPSNSPKPIASFVLSKNAVDMTR